MSGCSSSSDIRHIASGGPFILDATNPSADIFRCTFPPSEVPVPHRLLLHHLSYLTSRRRVIHRLHTSTASLTVYIVAQSKHFYGFMVRNIAAMHRSSIAQAPPNDLHERIFPVTNDHQAPLPLPFPFLSSSPRPLPLSFQSRPLNHLFIFHHPL